MLTLEYTGGFNPFDYIHCPFCTSDSFISLDYSGVYCDRCNTQFVTKHTAGDAGLVINAHFDNTWLFFNGKDINAEFLENLNNFNPKLVEGLNFRRKCYSNYQEAEEKIKQQYREYRGQWDNFLESFKLGRVLKTGEYDSGWITVVSYNDNSCRYYSWNQKANSDQWFDWLDKNYANNKEGV